MDKCLYIKHRVLDYGRAKRSQNLSPTLIQVEGGVQTTKDAQFYFGKRLVYVYCAKREGNGSKGRIIRGPRHSSSWDLQRCQSSFPQQLSSEVFRCVYPCGMILES
ncbi:60S ribosomal protein L33-A-like protein [Absidia repens]|uniref:60S ribosomal protein L33-A-like protein n=1 Tax=Absidia repens TaxID=90262 RepID=A0A1X2IVJ7_9FUNG|nr:60S ribosomal protein L33-A-like protein [Absidia repens]